MKLPPLLDPHMVPSRMLLVTLVKMKLPMPSWMQPMKLRLLWMPPLNFFDGYFACACNLAGDAVQAIKQK